MGGVLPGSKRLAAPELPAMSTVAMCRCWCTCNHLQDATLADGLLHFACRDLTGLGLQGSLAGGLSGVATLQSL